jgi:2-polyprenyl-6-methoxyphenol hydroxylase-like FAD-dependent oxidoreductase
MKIVIAGAGIGGLTTALLLHERGIECEIYEKVPELLQIGVGLALLPHAVRVYDSLRLLPELDKIGMRTEMSYFRTRHDQNVWEERRGIPAGYDVPQYAIHRTHLQQVLVDAVNSRLPEGSLHLDASF